LPVLTPADASARLERFLARPLDAMSPSEALFMLPGPWGETLSFAVVRATGVPPPLAAERIAPAAFAAMEAALPLTDDAPYHQQRQFEAARETLRMRRILHQELHP
jgi:hypothetical protein